jgi:hypothetical protein
MKPEILGYNPKNFSPENFKYREKAAKLTAHVDEPLEVNFFIRWQWRSYLNCVGE